MATRMIDSPGARASQTTLANATPDCVALCSHSCANALGGHIHANALVGTFRQAHWVDTCTRLMQAHWVDNAYGHVVGGHVHANPGLGKTSYVILI
eukprot:2896055-Pyramimonas_sp.AAC.1